MKLTKKQIREIETRFVVVVQNVVLLDTATEFDRGYTQGLVEGYTAVQGQTHVKKKGIREAIGKSTTSHMFVDRDTYDAGYYSGLYTANKEILEILRGLC